MQGLADMAVECKRRRKMKNTIGRWREILYTGERGRNGEEWDRETDLLR
jgi:hypothetical protein